MTRAELLRAQALGALRFCQSSWQGEAGAVAMLRQDLGASASICIRGGALVVSIQDVSDTITATIPLAPAQFAAAA